jgi:uncharacterized protein YqgC (DUF456 family)
VNVQIFLKKNPYCTKLEQIVNIELDQLDLNISLFTFFISFGKIWFMDLLLLFLGFLLMIVGIIGSVLPVLPGPIMGWLGLLILHFSKAIPINYQLLGITFFIAITIFFLDYIIPGLGAKKFGGSKKGAIGATLGLIIGLIVPIPLGFVIGAFLGALTGEMIHDPKDFKRALRSAFGSFIGFLASVTMKLLVSLVFTVIYIYEVVIHWSAFSLPF